jgi:GNAT superfamily N-acetyltransferase
MQNVMYRSATSSDLLGAAQVFIGARNEMLTRLGSGAPPDSPESAVAGFQHVLDTGIFEVAELDGRIVGKASAIVRDGLWFLSGFWVEPALKNQGIGGPLLRRAWQRGQELGAATFFVWASSDTTAMATYMKLGMLPGSQILTFRGEPERLRLPELPVGYETQPLEPTEASRIDSVVRGTRREVDHRYWADLPGRIVVRGGKLCGYYYLSDGQLFGGWLDPADGEAVLALGARHGLEHANRSLLRVAGMNHLAIRFALDHGYRLQQFSHLLTTGPFGKLDQYVTSGPLLF